MRVEIHAPTPAIAAILQKVALLNTAWSKAMPLIEAEMSAKLGRKVVLLTGSYVKQKKGQVIAVSTVKPLLPGYIYLQRKGWDAATQIFYVWVVVK